MLRSLYAGISGLRSHQVALDVTGNNIANVNTIGFKAGRATFKESMAQMLQGPSRPAGNQGGTNPLQIGLGTSIGSIDTMLRQGNMQTTGQITDLAIEGRAYFAFSSGNATFYSRNGGLQLDATGKLVSPTTGYTLQGKMADAYGNYTKTSTIGDIRIPWGEKSPAKATDEIKFACNLNSDSQAMGTVVHTNRFLANAGSAADELGAFGLRIPDRRPGALPTDTVPNPRLVLTNLFDANGNHLGIKEGDVLSASWADSTERFSFKVEKHPVTGEIPTLEEFLHGTYDERTPPPVLLQEGLEGYLNRITGGGVSVTFTAAGFLEITNGSGTPINGLQLTSDRKAESSSYITKAFMFPTTIPGMHDHDNDALTPDIAGVRPTAISLKVPAAAHDLLENLSNAAGEDLGFEAGDPINITGHVGSSNETGKFLFIPSNIVPGDILAGTVFGGFPTTIDGITYHGATSMKDLLDAIQNTFRLPPTDGTIHNRPSIEIRTDPDMHDGVPLGAIVIRGQPELAFALDGLSVLAGDSNYQTPSPTNFNSNIRFETVQYARDTFVHPTSLIVFDDAGAPHNVTMTFTHTGIPSEWMWEIQVNGEERAVSGNRGRLVFGVDGTPAAFTFDDGSNAFSFEPMNGASRVNMRINVGGPGSKEGVTQYASPTTTVARDQNGYPMGKLQEISIDERGEITGIYDNNQTKSIAQIYVAEFNNPAGLMKMGSSMFAVSNNSGYPTMYVPKTGTPSSIKPGALEMSNVELETEFTNMITIQRGYQSNARVITTSDQMLQELVQLVR